MKEMLKLMVSINILDLLKEEGMWSQCFYVFMNLQPHEGDGVVNLLRSNCDYSNFPIMDGS